MRVASSIRLMAGEADAADPTELAGVAEMGTESVEAWSTAEDYPIGLATDRSALHRWALPIAALVVAVAAVGAAATFGVRTFTVHRGGPVSVPSTRVDSSRTVVLTQPDQDTAFLMDLDRTGTIYDAAGVAIHNARLVCKMLGAGKPST